MSEMDPAPVVGDEYDVSGVRLRIVGDNRARLRSLLGSILVFNFNMVLDSLGGSDLYRIEASVDGGRWFRLENRARDHYQTRARLRRIISTGDSAQDTDWWREFQH